MITTSATLPVFGEYIHDPVEVVARVDSTVAAVLGALTFIIATIGINIVANFVSPAFDFANVSPKHITFIRGGMIAAVGSVFVMPWHLFNSPDVIHYTLDTLGAAIGPLYGILVADYFIVKHEKLFVDDLYSDKPDGHYWYSNGFNPAAVKALIIGFVIAAHVRHHPAALLPGELLLGHRRCGRQLRLRPAHEAPERAAGLVGGGAYRCMSPKCRHQRPSSATKAAAARRRNWRPA